MTREDLVELLAKTQATLDAKLLVKSLQMTLDFEKGLVGRFSSSREDADNAQSGPSLKFSGIVSTCFESYLKLYLDAENKWVH